MPNNFRIVVKYIQSPGNTYLVFSQLTFFCSKNTLIRSNDANNSTFFSKRKKNHPKGSTPSILESSAIVDFDNRHNDKTFHERNKLK